MKGKREIIDAALELKKQSENVAGEVDRILHAINVLEKAKEKEVRLLYCETQSEKVKMISTVMKGFLGSEVGIACNDISNTNADTFKKRNGYDFEPLSISMYENMWFGKLMSVHEMRSEGVSSLVLAFKDDVTREITSMHIIPRSYEEEIDIITIAEFKNCTLKNIVEVTY